MKHAPIHIGRLDPPLEAIPPNHATMAQALRDIADRLERGEALMGAGRIDFKGRSVYTRGGLVGLHEETGFDLTLSITTSR